MKIRPKGNIASIPLYIKILVGMAARHQFANEIRRAFSEALVQQGHVFGIVLLEMHQFVDYDQVHGTKG